MSKRSLMLICVAVAAVVVAGIYFGGGALWHMLLRMHGH